MNGDGVARRVAPSPAVPSRGLRDERAVGLSGPDWILIGELAGNCPVASRPGIDECRARLHRDAVLQFAISSHCEVQAVFAKGLEQDPGARGQRRGGRLRGPPHAPEMHADE